MRWLRHLFARSAAASFPLESLHRIAEAIARGERRHTGQVCFAVEASLSLRSLWRRADSRQRARVAFSRLRVWDTEANNGVLIYLLLADRRIEVVADRGLKGAAIDARWARLCEHLGQRLHQRLNPGDYEAAVLEAVEEASDALAEVFPRGATQAHPDELPNAPQLLD